MDFRTATIDVTFAVDAADAYEAFGCGRPLFAAATTDSRFARPVVAVNVEVSAGLELEAV